MQIRRVITASLLAALCCVATLAVQIPVPAANGYIHPGDAMVLLAGFFLPPLPGAMAAGIGSALADIMTGYTHYAAATFLIKALMAVTARGLYAAVYGLLKRRLIGLAAGAAAAEGLMIAGYFLYTALITGLPSAVASVPENAVQAAFGVVSSVVLSAMLLNHPFFRNELAAASQGDKQAP